MALVSSGIKPQRVPGAFKFTLESEVLGKVTTENWHVLPGQKRSMSAQNLQNKRTGPVQRKNKITADLSPPQLLLARAATLATSRFVCKIRQLQGTNQHRICHAL